jgi:hypothetical protein
VDKLDKQIYNEIFNRKETKEPYEQFFNRLFQIELSETEARKELMGIKNYLSHKQDNICNEIDFIESQIPQKESFELNKDGSRTIERVVALSQDELNDTNALLKKHGFDPLKWELISAKNSIWNANTKKEGIATLYSSKITTKPRMVNITTLDVEKLFDDMINKKPKNLTPKRNISIKEKDYVYEVPMMDVHFGKMAHHSEVGEDYDLKIAKERYLNTIKDLAKRIEYKKDEIDFIIFPIGQDFINYDNPNNTTTAGTPQDSDTRWSKIFTEVTDITVTAIEILRQIAPVKIMYVAGNHDMTMSYYITNYIYAYYRNDEDIEVDRSPMSRKYIKFGECLIGYTHSDKEKKRLETIMPIEVPQLWGQTKFREFHVGHLHHEQVLEVNGIKIRKISSITSTDAWHFTEGYIGNLRMAQGFLWNKSYGLLEIYNSPII